MDKVLGKDKIVEYLKNLGMKDEEVQKNWESLVKSFTIFFLTGVYQAIPDKDKGIINFGIDSSTEEGMQRLLDLTNKYLNGHQDMFNTNVIAQKAASQVVDTLKESINSQLEQIKNGK